MVPIFLLLLLLLLFHSNIHSPLPSLPFLEYIKKKLILFWEANQTPIPIHIAGTYIVVSVTGQLRVITR